VIFEAELESARQKLKAIEELLQRLTDARGRAHRRLEQLSGFQAVFEAGLALARSTREWQVVPTYSPGTGEVWQEALFPDHHRHIRDERENWSRAIARLTHLRDKLDRKAREVEERRARLASWLRNKEETWGKIEPGKLKGQVRDVLLAAEELSQLVVGKKLPIAFDTADSAPLGYVPIHKEKTGHRKVYLSAAILAEQPEHLLDYYRALIVHELGHVLLHLKDSGKDYNRLRRLIREKISLAPDFFPRSSLSLG
jgi:hypothetical protein